MKTAHHAQAMGGYLSVCLRIVDRGVNLRIREPTIVRVLSDLEGSVGVIRDPDEGVQETQGVPDSIVALSDQLGQGCDGEGSDDVEHGANDLMKSMPPLFLGLRLRREQLVGDLLP